MARGGPDGNVLLAIRRRLPCWEWTTPPSEIVAEVEEARTLLQLHQWTLKRSAMAVWQFDATQRNSQVQKNSAEDMQTASK